MLAFGEMAMPKPLSGCGKIMALSCIVLVVLKRSKA